MTRAGAVWLLFYLAWMTLLVGGLFWARRAALAAYGGPQARAEWNEFRRDMQRLSRQGPVERRAPKSEEPPALVLTRDYFGVCLAATLVFGSLLFVMLFGAVRAASTADFEPHKPRRSTE